MKTLDLQHLVRGPCNLILVKLHHYTKLGYKIFESCVPLRMYLHNKVVKQGLNSEIILYKL